eukprot:6472015-Amphidinium_carterae.2
MQGPYTVVPSTASPLCVYLCELTHHSQPHTHWGRSPRMSSRTDEMPGAHFRSKCKCHCEPRVDRKEVVPQSGSQPPASAR